MKKFGTVLLVDDDELTNQLNERMIRKLGMADDVQTALNGKMALEFLDAHLVEGVPNLVLLDIDMPVMNGFEFMEVYRKEFQEKAGWLVVMMLTTSINQTDLERAKSFDAVSEFIGKPLNQQKIELIKAKYL